MNQEDPFADIPAVPYRPAADPFADIPAVPYRPTPTGNTWQERAGSVGTSAAQALTFGLADEARAAVRGGVRKLKGEEYGKAYGEELETARAADKRLAERAPGGQWLGPPAAAAITAPLTVARAGLTLPQLMYQGSKVGAATGTATGFGSGEGGFENRAQSAAEGGVLGALLGGAIPLGMEAIAKPVRALYNRLIGRGVAEAEARKILQNALQDEGGDPGAAIRAANAAGVDEHTIADVSRQAKDLLRDVGGAPNPQQAPVKEFIGRRQQGELVPGEGWQGGQYGRIKDLIRDKSNVGGKRGFSTLDEAEKTRRNLARPQYREADQFDTSQSPALKTLWDRFLQTGDTAKGTLREVRRLWDLEYPGQPYPLDAKYLAGDPAKRVTPNFQTMRLVKEGLDAEADKAFTAGAGKRGGLIADLRNELRDTMKGENPAYKLANDTYAGRMSMERAFKAGESFLNDDPDKIASLIRDYGASEADMYRVAAVNKLQQLTLDKTKPGEMTDFARKVMSPGMLERIHAILPDRETREYFDRYILGQAAQSETAHVFGGSQTQPRAQTASMVEAGRKVINFLMDLNTGFGTAGARAGTAAAESARQAKAAAVRGEMGKMLTRTDEAAAKLADQLSKAGPRVGAQAVVPGGMVAGTTAPQIDTPDFLRERARAGGDLLNRYLPLESFGVPGVGRRQP